MKFDLGELKTAADTTDAMAAVVPAVAKGEIAPTDALDGRLIESFMHAHETRAMEGTPGVFGAVGEGTIR